MSIFHGEDGFFGPTKVQEAYNIIIFLFLMENSILKIFSSMDKFRINVCNYFILDIMILVTQMETLHYILLPKMVTQILYRISWTYHTKTQV